MITGIQTALTTAEAVQLQELARGLVVLELGAHMGASTIALAQTAGRVHSVDWHQGDSMVAERDTLAIYIGNLRRHGVANVVTHVGRFEDVLPLLQPHSFDGCFLDGEHDRTSVERDTRLAMHLVRHGGWFAWHDYGRFEVAEAVERCIGPWTRDLRQVDWLAWLDGALPRLDD